MDVLVLDGGASTEIHNLGIQSIHSDPLWSSRLVITKPDVIKQLHRSFLDHGADIIQTISYQASIQLLCKYADQSIEDAKATMQKSVHLARESVEEFWTDYKKKREDSDSTTDADRCKPMVCACIGPYGSQLLTAEEYTGNYIDSTTEQDIITYQRPRIEALVSAGVDYFALETIPVQKEAEVVSKLMREFPNVKTWVSFQCRDNAHVGHGEKFSDAVESVAKDGYIKYLGVNCCSPTFVTPLLESIQRQRQGYSLQFVAYPNNGQVWEKENVDAEGRFIGPSLMGEFEEAIPKWIDLGTSIIGGCCQTTPKDIKFIRDYVKERSGTRNGGTTVAYSCQMK